MLIYEELAKELRDAYIQHEIDQADVGSSSRLTWTAKQERSPWESLPDRRKMKWYALADIAVEHFLQIILPAAFFGIIKTLEKQDITLALIVRGSIDEAMGKFERAAKGIPCHSLDEQLQPTYESECTHWWDDATHEWTKR